MYRILRRWGSFSILLALLVCTAAYLPSSAAESDAIGFTDWEQFAYDNADQMLAFNFSNLRGEIKLEDGNLVIPSPASNSQGANGIKKNGAVQQRAYILEARFKLDYPENPVGSTAIIIYDGQTRNDYRFFPNQVNHRNSTGTGGAWNTFSEFPHESGKWYTYRFEADGDGYGMTYRKADGETDFTPVFPEKQLLNNNTGAAAIDMFAEGATTNISMTIDYLKTYSPFTATLGDGADAGLQAAQLDETFGTYGEQTITADSENLQAGPWKMAFRGENPHTAQAIFGADGTLTLNANGDTQTLSCDANLTEFHDAVFDIRCKITGSPTSSQGLGIQINGETDRIFLRVNNQRIHYNKGKTGWINNTFQTPADGWMHIRVEKIGAKANVYCKNDSDAEYTQVFANMDTIPKTAQTNYFISLFIESAADMAVIIDSASLHTAGSYSVSHVFDGQGASAYQIADYSEYNAGTTRDFRAFLASYTTDSQKLQAVASSSLAIGAGESGSLTVSLPQQPSGSVLKSLLWKKNTMQPLYPVMSESE